MYVNQKRANKLIQESLADIGSSLKAFNKQLGEFAEEDDWSFVIKSHALIEAAVTRLLTETLDDVRLYSTLERLPLSDISAGKLSLAKELDLLEKEQLRFVRWFSELRNNLVHKPENLSFKFKDHLDGLDKNQRRAFVDAVSGKPKPEGDDRCFRELCLTKPKISIWMQVFSLVACCYVTGRHTQVLKRVSEMSEVDTKDYLECQDALIKAQAEAMNSFGDLLDP